MSSGSSYSSYKAGWFSVAVQALVMIAGAERPCSSARMAQDIKAHAVHIRRVLAQLARAQLVQAREGRDGGYRLTRPADQITLAEIYQAVSPTDPAGSAACKGGVDVCVQIVLDEIGTQAEQCLLEVLRSHTLSSILRRVGISHQPS